MGKNIFCIILLMVFIFISCGQNTVSPTENESKFSTLQGPYLGQKPPGTKPELFAFDLLSLGCDVSKISFSEDGQEMCYDVVTTYGSLLGKPNPTGPFLKGFVFHAKVKDGYWTEPKEQMVVANQQRNRLRYAFISPDGKRLFFNYHQKKSDSSDPFSTDMWFAQRVNGEWENSKEITFENEYMGTRSGIYPTAAANGNLYFTLWPRGRDNGTICMSRWENGSYSKFEILSDNINSTGGNHPYIATDESYIIFDGTLAESEENYGGNDLLISFRDKDGNWTRTKNLGKTVNSSYHEFRPFVSFDGKYLFFSSNRIEKPEISDEPLTLREIRQLCIDPPNGFQNIYWVDASVIEELRPK